VTIPAQTNGRSLDRGIYVPAAIAICALVGTGFWPSYFSKLLSSPSEPLTILVHVHGVLMTAWMSLFLVQVALVAAGRVDLHRRLGVWGFALLVLIVVVAVPTTIVATIRGGNHMPGPALPGLALVASLFIEFAVLAGLGLSYRHRSDIHKRLMVLAACAAMEAGVSRLPLGFLDTSVKIHLANDLLPLAVIGIDTVRHRRLHPAFLWGFVSLVAVQMLSAWVAGTQWWLHIAQGIMSSFR
jgi:uncharacterized membrane protein YozB (DUF420 family)